MPRVRRCILVLAVSSLLAGSFVVANAVGASRGPNLPAAFASNPSGKGYWVVYPNGHVRAFGTARLHGGADRYPLRQPIVGIASTKTGKGYWLVASDGGIFSFGDARFRGSLGNLRLNRPITGMARTPSGRGYWLVASDGGVFSFGDARFLGSSATLALHAPVVGMAPTRTGRGYWLVASDGGVFSFGDAGFLGSGPQRGLRSAVTGINASPDGRAYWMSTLDGHVHGFGRAGAAAGSAVRRGGRLLVGLSTANGTWRVLDANGRVVRYAEVGGASGADGITLPAPQYISNDIGDYTRQPGNQIIVVPNGRYRGSGNTITPPPRDTSGRMHGWLVLVAETRGGAVIDLANAPLELGKGDWRVLFVGFRFVNGTVSPSGEHIAFWYSDFSFPTNVWQGQSYYEKPRTFDVNQGSSKHVALYGSDIHDTSTLLRASNSTDVRLEGTRLYGSTQTALGHNDAISCRGGCNDFTIRDSEIEGRVIFTDGESRELSSGRVGGLSISNVWFSDSPSAGVFFGALARAGGEARGVFGSMDDVWIWGANGVARMEQILQPNGSLRSYYNDERNTEPSRVRVTESNVRYARPPSGAAGPAQQWRAVHPYSSWPQFFDFVGA
jgi:hypothetical protein